MSCVKNTNTYTTTRVKLFVSVVMFMNMYANSNKTC